MCKAGGPRCTGRGRQGAASSAPSGSAATAVAEKPTVPTRDDADRLAGEMPADRKDAFGQVLDERGRRLFALRESGYTGPIDQDGYPATTGEGADILRRMAEKRGETVTW